MHASHPEAPHFNALAKRDGSIYAPKICARDHGARFLVNRSRFPSRAGKRAWLTSRESGAYHFFGTAFLLDALSPSLLHPPSRME